MVRKTKDSLKVDLTYFSSFNITPCFIYTDLTSNLLDPRLVDLGWALIYVGAYGRKCSIYDRKTSNVNQIGKYSKTILYYIFELTALFKRRQILIKALLVCRFVHFLLATSSADLKICKYNRPRKGGTLYFLYSIAITFFSFCFFYNYTVWL